MSSSSAVTFSPVEASSGNALAPSLETWMDSAGVSDEPGLTYRAWCTTSVLTKSWSDWWL